MKNPVLLLPLIQTIILAQILVPPNLSLLSATDPSVTSDPKLAKVAIYILESHPELENATVLDMAANTGGNGTVSADYFFTLRNANTTLLVAVSITPNTSEFFVSLTNLAPETQQPAPHNLKTPLTLAINNNTQTP